MKKLILNHLWWIAFLLALILLIVHSLKIAEVSVDSTSILLLIIILISPFISTLKKIKYGDFEAEIDPKEIQTIKENIENNLDLADYEELRPETIEEVESIRNLAKSDSIIALAKIRIELEKILSLLASRTLPDYSKQPLGRLVTKLTNHEIILPHLGRSLSEVISICNRAIHGEHISKESSATIIELGIELLEELNWTIIESSSIGTIVNEEIISPKDVDQYSNNNRRFRLTTVTPLVENPKRTTRELTHFQLEDVLEDYDEYAEFIVELVEITDEKAKN